MYTCVDMVIEFICATPSGRLLQNFLQISLTEITIYLLYRQYPLIAPNQIKYKWKSNSLNSLTNGAYYVQRKASYLLIYQKYTGCFIKKSNRGLEYRLIISTLLWNHVTINNIVTRSTRTRLYALVCTSTQVI